MNFSIYYIFSSNFFTIYLNIFDFRIHLRFEFITIVINFKERIQYVK